MKFLICIIDLMIGKFLVIVLRLSEKNAERMM